VSKHIVKL